MTPKLVGLLGNWKLHLVVLTAIIWAVFGRTLSGYFLADDFGEILYVSRIAAGQWNLLWSNFTGNYMQIPGMAVWRPWLIVSLLTDYTVWHSNALGYYLTNLLSYNATVLLFYILLRQLARQQKHGTLMAFLSAAIFSLSPLHCESVSWVVGRVDIVCAVFYLLALVLCFKADEVNKCENQKFYIAGATLAFWLSIWTKEMSIGLAPLATLALLLFGREPMNLRRIGQVVLPLWVSLLVYFPLRFLALGTLLGGYVQGIGDAQAAGAISRWLDGDTWRRLFFPFAYSIYSDHSLPQLMLGLCYVVLLTLFVVRLLGNRVNWAWFVFIFFWMATTLAPLYKLWGLGYELEGARFCFFVTMPLSAMSSLVLFGQRHSNRSATTALATAALAAIALVFCGAARKTNLEWVHAGGAVRRFLQETASLAEQVAESGRKLIVLGIPKRHGGAHMILNGDTLRTAVSPPFTKTNHASNCLTFDPILFTETYHLDTSAFKTALGTGKALIVGWNESDSKLESFTLPEPSSSTLEALQAMQPASGQGLPYSPGHIEASANNGLTLSHIGDGDGLLFKDLHVEPMSCDFLEVKFKSQDRPDGPQKIRFKALFGEEPQAQVNTLVQAAPGERESQTAYLPLSQNWRWYRKSPVGRIVLQLPAGHNIQVESLKLLAANSVQPQVTLSGLSANSQNYYSITGTQAGLPIAVTLPDGLKGARLLVELTAANAFFDNDEDQDKAAATVQTFTLSPAQTAEARVNLQVDKAKLEGKGFHQLRVKLIAADGEALGPPSCPVTFELL
jgi:hypothetical protein